VILVSICSLLEKMTAHLRNAFIFAVGILFFFNLLFLQTYPLPSCDEATYASNADAVLKRGNFGLTIWNVPEPFGRDQNMVHMGRLAALGESLLFRIAGVSLFAARLYSLIAWILSIFLIYQIGKRFWDSSIGAAASLLFAASFKSFFSGHLGRPDIWATTAILVATFAALEIFTKPKSSFGFYILAGGVAVIPFDYHANGLWFLGAFCLTLFFVEGWQKQNWRGIFSYGVGVVVGGLLWGLTHFLPSPAQSWYQLTTGHNLSSYFSLTHNLVIFLDWLRDSSWAFGGLTGLLDLIIAAGGMLIALYTPGRANRALLSITFISLLAFAVFMGQKFVVYGILWLPFTCLLGALAVKNLTQRLFSRIHIPAETMLAMFVATYCVINIGVSSWLAYRVLQSDFPIMSERVQQSVPAGARVLADPIWWWSLSANHVYLNEEFVLVATTAEKINHGTRTIEQIVDEMFQNLNIEYVLFDEAIACLYSPHSEWHVMNTYLNSKCEKLGEIVGTLNKEGGNRSNPLAQKITLFKCGAKNVSVQIYHN